MTRTAQLAGTDRYWHVALVRPPGCTPGMTPKQELLAVATRQHGVVSREDLSMTGITRSARRRMLDRGDLVAMGPTAHRLAGFPLTAHQAVLIACIEHGAIASHLTSASLHRLGPAMLLPIHVLGTRSSRWRALDTPGTLHTTTNLPADDITHVDGIPCTSVARTLLLLAGQPGADESWVRTLVDEAVRDGKASDPWLWWRLERLRCRGRSGVSMLCSILTDRAGGNVTESWLERRFLTLVADAGLPKPRCQQRIDHHGSFVGRVDFLFEQPRLVVEVLGHAFHASPEQLRADAERRARLVLAGYRVLEFTYDQIVRDPLLVVAMLSEALGLTQVS